MSKSSPFNFLKLPIEIRLQIYDLFAIPHMESTSAYKGLYISCRQIKQEMDKQCTRAPHEHYKRAQNQWGTNSGLRLYLPSGYAGARCPLISISALVFAFHATRHTRFSEAGDVLWLPSELASLMCLHLDSITLILGDGDLENQDASRWNQMEITWQRLVVGSIAYHPTLTEKNATVDERHQYEVNVQYVKVAVDSPSATSIFQLRDPKDPILKTWTRTLADFGERPRKILWTRNVRFVKM